MSELQIWTRAEQLLAQNKIDSAFHAYSALRNSEQLAIAARMRLSLIAGRSGNYRGAVDEAANATTCLRSDTDPHASSMLFKRLIAVGEAELALTVANHPSIQTCRELEPLVEIGKLLSDFGHANEAHHLLSRANGLGLDNAAVRFLLGTCQMRQGQPADAERNFELGIQLDPAFTPNHWQLAKLGRVQNTRNHVDRLKHQLSMATSAMDRAVLGYALFKELDEIGDYSLAWSAWESAAAELKAANAYVVDRDIALIEQIIDSAKELDKRKPPAANQNEQVPIFIVGLPRSGTTLLERMLGRHSNIQVGGELPDLLTQLRYVANVGGPATLDSRLTSALPSVDVVQWGYRYLEHTRWRHSGRRHLTDKLPTNFRMIGWIRHAIPQARIIHMRREPIAACFSNLRECFFAGGYGYSNDMQDMVRYYHAYRRLMEVWNDRCGDVLHEVHYEEMVSQPAETVTRILRHCGLSMEPQCLDTSGIGDVVATASAAQVRQPIHSRSVSHWRNYEKQLQPLINGLTIDLDT